MIIVYVLLIYYLSNQYFGPCYARVYVRKRRNMAKHNIITHFSHILLFHATFSTFQSPFSSIFPLLSFSLSESNFLASLQTFVVPSKQYRIFLYPYNPFSFYQILFSLCSISLPPNYPISYLILQSTCLLFYYYFHLFINVNGNLFTWLAY